MQIILASASPRRTELLKGIVEKFDVIPSVEEERADKSLPPPDYVCALAENKCDSVFKTHEQSLVIGCDTAVFYEDKVLGKPKNPEDAKSTLKMLSGKTHLVVSGVCVRSPYKKIVRSETTEVKFNLLSDEFIEGYVAGGSPMDKAGSYGIQDDGVVRSYFGSYTNVVGLPVGLVKKMIAEAMTP